MPFHETNSIRYLTFNHFEHAGLVHGIFTRQGGVSPQPWDLLNAGATVGDEIENVRENRRRSLAAFNRPMSVVYDSRLVHGTEVAFVESPRPPEMSPHMSDILLTDRPDVTLYMRFADCVPILLFDPIEKIAGIAHSGWMGTVKRVGAVAVQAMVEHYGCNPGNIMAGIGPSICVDHYQVGANVVEQVRNAFGETADQLLIQYEDDIHFDLWKANEIILRQAGIIHIEQSQNCTASHIENWYSHRVENDKTGRFGAIIALQ